MDSLLLNIVHCVRSYKGLVLPSGQKLTLGLLATITLEVTHLLRVCTVPSASAIYKCILEVVFCKSDQHRLRVASITSVVSKWRPFSFIFSQANREK
jgi:hypothetical protein